MRKIILSIILLISISEVNITAQEWSALGPGMTRSASTGESAFVAALTQYNGELYAGGYFDAAGGTTAKNIAKWNGSNWSNVGSGVVGRVRAMAVFNGELYVAGELSIAGGIPVKNIAKWNGTTWSTVGSGLNDGVRALVVYMEALYVGGHFDTAGGIASNRIAKWNGTTWNPVGSGIDLLAYDLPHSFVASLAVHNGNLYAGGSFDAAGGIPANRIAKWNGTNWSAVGQGVNNEYVLAMASFGGMLYAAGSFWIAENQPVNNIIRWDGTNWLPVGEGLNQPVYCLAIYNNTLYAGGTFNGTGDIGIKHIAKLNGTNWLPLGHGTEGTVLALAPMDSSLYVGGSFDYADKNCQDEWLIVTNKIAKWSDYCSTTPRQPCNIIGDTIVCPGSIQTYTLNSITNATSYEWILPPGWTGNSSSSTITANAGTSGGIISVIAKNSCGNSIPQTLQVATGQIPPLAPEYIHGDYYVCQNSVHIYSINPVNGATNYTWDLPAGWTGSSTTNSITTTVGATDGTIYVTANNNCGSSNAHAISVEIIPSPSQPSVITGSNNVCAGTSQAYSINPVYMAADYTWILPSGWAGSSTSNTISATTNANGGTISVTANNQCGISMPRIMPVTVTPILQRPISIMGDDTVCQGNSQTYFVDPLPDATNYLWTLPSGWSGNSTTNAITTTVGTSGGIISVIARNICSQSNPQTLSVTINAPPQPGAISGSGSVNYGQTVSYSINQVAGATDYTWSLNGGGTITSGQNTNSIIVSWQTPGNYAVSVSASNSCGTSIDQTLAVTVSVATGVSNLDNSFEVTILPNPSNGEFYLKVKRVQGKVIKVDVLSMTGQLVFRGENKQGANDYTQFMDLKKMAQGIYIAKITIDDKVYSKKIVKNK